MDTDCIWPRRGATEVQKSEMDARKKNGHELYKKCTRLMSGAGEARNAVIFKGHINVEK